MRDEINERLEYATAAGKKSTPGDAQQIAARVAQEQPTINLRIKRWNYDPFDAKLHETGLALSHAHISFATDPGTTGVSKCSYSPDQIREIELMLIEAGVIQSDPTLDEIDRFRRAL